MMNTKMALTTKEASHIKLDPCSFLSLKKLKKRQMIIKGIKIKRKKTTIPFPILISQHLTSPTVIRSPNAWSTLVILSGAPLLLILWSFIPMAWPFYPLHLPFWGRTGSCDHLQAESQVEMMCVTGQSNGLHVWGTQDVSCPSCLNDSFSLGVLHLFWYHKEDDTEPALTRLKQEAQARNKHFMWEMSEMGEFDF